MKKKKPTVTVETKTLVEQCYALAKTLNPASRFSENKSGDQELVIYPQNNNADKIVVSAIKSGNDTRINGIRVVRGDNIPFISIETKNEETIKFACKVILSVIKANC